MSVLGVHTASIVHVLAAVAGVSAIVVASSMAFTAVKVVGGLLPDLPRHQVVAICAATSGDGRRRSCGRRSNCSPRGSSSAC